jgi:ketosteroid isomerase-like protein
VSKTAILPVRGMTEVNVQTVRKVFDAFVRRDVQAALEVMDEDVDLSAPATQALVDRDLSYRGHDGIRTYFEDVAEVWEELEVFLHEYHDLGDGRVLVSGRVRARDRDGLLVDQPAQWGWVIKDGKVAWGRVFTNRNEAFEALELGVAG